MYELVGSIAIHICEHVKRNSIRFSSSEHVSFEKGIEEYFPCLHLSSEELAELVNEAFYEFYTVMEKLIDNMSQEIDMHGLYHVVEHTGYHLGQIVDRSKRVKGIGFNFCQNGINERSLKLLIERK